MRTAWIAGDSCSNAKFKECYWGRSEEIRITWQSDPAWGKETLEGKLLKWNTIGTRPRRRTLDWTRWHCGSQPVGEGLFAICHWLYISMSHLSDYDFLATGNFVILNLHSESRVYKAISWLPRFTGARAWGKPLRRWKAVHQNGWEASGSSIQFDRKAPCQDVVWKTTNRTTFQDSASSYRTGKGPFKLSLRARRNHTFYHTFYLNSYPTRQRYDE